MRARVIQDRCLLCVDCPSKSVTFVFLSACLKLSQNACFKDSRGCVRIMIGFVECLDDQTDVAGCDIVSCYVM